MLFHSWSLGVNNTRGPLLILGKENVMGLSKEAEKYLVDLCKMCMSRLNLRRTVTFCLDESSPNCRSFVDFIRKEYRIYIPQQALANVSSIEGDIISEFCRFKLGEEIDPIFSMPIFLTKYNNKEFEDKMMVLFFAQSHIDIWVRELRNQHWPDLMLREQKIFPKILVIAIQRFGKDFLQNLGVQIATAQYHAEQVRYGFENDINIFSVINFLGVSIDERFPRLTEYLVNLPRLSFDKEKDLKILEQTTLDISQILQLSVNPKLVRENNLWVWDLD